jgi:hypothetical protein
VLALVALKLIACDAWPAIEHDWQYFSSVFLRVASFADILSENYGILDVVSNIHHKINVCKMVAATNIALEQICRSCDSNELASWLCQTCVHHDVSLGVTFRLLSLLVSSDKEVDAQVVAALFQDSALCIAAARHKNVGVRKSFYDLLVALSQRRGADLVDQIAMPSMLGQAGFNLYKVLLAEKTS